MMEKTPYLDWQVLTKRPENIMRMVLLSWKKCWPEHILIGASVEDQKRADERIPHLLTVPAKIRFVSAEPLLGPINFLEPDFSDAGHGQGWLRAGNAAGGPQISWVITGGESGPGARPMKPEWADSIRLQCARNDVAYFHKQNGGAHKIDGVWGGRELYGEVYHAWPDYRASF